MMAASTTSSGLEYLPEFRRSSISFCTSGFSETFIGAPCFSHFHCSCGGPSRSWLIAINLRQHLTHQFNVHFQDSGDLRDGLLLSSQPRNGDALLDSFLQAVPQAVLPGFLVGAAFANV